MNRRAMLGVVVFAAGCGGSAPVDPGSDRPAALTTHEGLEYQAETLIMESFPVQLRTLVHIRNVGSSAKHLRFPDGCVVLLRAYREGSSAVAWDQGHTVGCTLALVQADLAPGETRTFDTRTDARAILGDSLPDDRYVLRAYLRPNGGSVLVDAGAADLGVPR